MYVVWRAISSQLKTLSLVLFPPPHRRSPFPFTQREGETWSWMFECLVNEVKQLFSPFHLPLLIPAVWHPSLGTRQTTEIMVNDICSRRRGWRWSDRWITPSLHPFPLSDPPQRYKCPPTCMIMHAYVPARKLWKGLRIIR